MYEDEPQDKVHDVLGRRPSSATTRSAGRSSAAPRWSSSVPVPEIAAYHDDRYVGGEPRASPRPATSTTTARRARSGEARRAAPPGRRRRLDEPLRAAIEPRAPLPRARRPSSTTSASAAPGIARGDERRFALRVLDTILGGSTSSRLFQEVREKRGLAYSVYSYASQYVDTRPDRRLRRHAAGQRRRGDGDDRPRADARSPPTASPPKSWNGRARTSRAAPTLSMESTLARMNRLGSSVLMGVPAADARRDPRRARRRDADDVAALAAELYVPGAAVGRRRGGDEDTFRAALGAGRARQLARVIRVAVSGAAGKMGDDGVRAPSRAPTTWADRPRRPCARHDARRRPRRRRRGRRLHTARHRPRQRAASASRPASTA